MTRSRRRRRAARWVWTASVALAVGLGAAAVVLSGRSATEGVWVALAAAALAVGALFIAPTTSGMRPTAASAVAAALPLVSWSSGERIFDYRGALAVIAAGVAGAWALWTLTGRDQRVILTDMIRYATAFAAYAGMFELADRLGPWAPVVAYAAGSSAAFLVEVAAGAFLRIGERGWGWRYSAGLAVRDLDVFLGVTAAGAMFGLTFEAVGWWALAVALVPYSFVHFALVKFRHSKRTYSQTIRALAQIPEAAGHVAFGHAVRTADLATAVARYLGLRPLMVERVEYAALMHDIGRISLNEPGVVRRGYTEQDIARWGAEIVGETEQLVPVAEIVRRQHEPYRYPGVDRNPNVPVASRIVRVCSAYDEAVSELGASPREALAQLERSTAFDYDPEVVSALRTVLELHGALAHPVTTG